MASEAPPPPPGVVDGQAEQTLTMQRDLSEMGADQLTAGVGGGPRRPSARSADGCSGAAGNAGQGVIGIIAPPTNFTNLAAQTEQTASFTGMAVMRPTNGTSAGSVQFGLADAASLTRVVASFSGLPASQTLALHGDESSANRMAACGHSHPANASHALRCGPPRPDTWATSAM